MAKNVEASKKSCIPWTYSPCKKKKSFQIYVMCVWERQSTHIHTHTNTKQNYNQNMVWLFTAAYHLTAMFADFFSSLGFMQSLKIWESF